ncbi:MAG: hypothetical protein RLW61_08475 [Gammaproteobacteria bacterium]
MATDSVRELSRKWAAGDIDRETYRRQRRALIEDVVSGARPLVPYRVPEPPQPTVFPYDDDDGDTTQEIIAPVVAAAARGHAGTARAGRWALLLGIAAVALSAVLGWWLQSNHGGPAGESVTRATAASPAAPSPGLLEDFLAAKLWSTAHLEQLARAWQSLTAEQRAALAASDDMRRFTDALLAQLAGERALADLGDAEHARARQEELLTLARRLGVADVRLERARESLRDGRAAASNPPEQ